MIVSVLIAGIAFGVTKRAEAGQYQYIALDQAPIQRYASERDGSDRYFLETQMLAHQDVIASSEYVLNHSADASVKKTAQNMYASHGEELAQMKRLYMAWYEEDPDQYITDEYPTAPSESWTDSGYLKHVRALHIASVDAAQMELMSTRRGQLAELCQQIIYMRTQEINSFSPAKVEE